MDELKEAALSYAARGWAVFRLQEMGKVPFRGSNGVLDATSDPAQIAALWDETPNANIGIAAGASGLLLVDVDNKDGRDGFTSWDVQRVTHLVDDTTPHVWTPHNGKHLYFAAPPGLDLRNTDDELGPGIETKANGKYLVAPPSRLPDGVYRWDERLNLDTTPLATFPPSLAAQIVKQPKVERPPMDYRPTSDTAATIVDALRYLGPWDGSYEWWLDILMAIHSELPGGDGLQIAEAWGDGKDGEIAKKWKGFHADGKVTVGTLYYEAKARGWVPPWRQTRTVTQAQPDTDEPPGWLDDESADLGLSAVTTTKPDARVTITADNPATWADMARLIGPVCWEWPGYLPSELLSLMVGDSGAGKSIVGMRIVGTYTCGWPWPDNTPYTGEAGKVLWCESEAAQAVNLERATAWGIPLDCVLSPFANPLDDVNLFDAEHLAAIARVAARDDVRLVIVDSLSGATGGKGKGEDLMPIVKWLAELARDLHKPVLVLHHLRKRGMFDTGEVVTLDRVRDSTVIIQPSRVVWAIDAPNGNEPEHKRLSVIKSNLGKFPPALGLHIGDDGLTFDDAPQPPKVETQIDKAKDLLKSLLDRGPMASIDLESEARGAGISWDTMKRAKDALGVVARRDGKAGKWYWALSYGQEAEQEADA